MREVSAVAGRTGSRRPPNVGAVSEVTRRKRPSIRVGLAVFLPVFAALATGCVAAPAREPAARPPSAAAPPVTPVPDPVLPHRTFTLDSKVLGEPRLVNVYTPPGYTINLILLALMVVGLVLSLRNRGATNREGVA